MDAIAEEIKKLTEAIAEVTPFAMGYSVRSLCEVDGDKTHNIFTVLKFSKDNGLGENAEIVPGTKLQVIRTWISLDQGNQAIADASDSHSFALNSTKVDFYPEIGRAHV